MHKMQHPKVTLRCFSLHFQLQNVRKPPFFFSQAPIDRQHRSPTKQQEWRNQKAPPSTKLSVCLSVRLSLEKRARGGGGEGKGEVVEAPARQICQSFICGRTNKQKPPKTFLGFLSGKEGIEEEEEEGWRIW